MRTDGVRLMKKALQRTTLHFFFQDILHLSPSIFGTFFIFLDFESGFCRTCVFHRTFCFTRAAMSTKQSTPNSNGETRDDMVTASQYCCSSSSIKNSRRIGIPSQRVCAHDSFFVRVASNFFVVSFNLRIFYVVV